MNLKTMNNVLEYIENEISEKRSEQISFSFEAAMPPTKEIYRKLIAMNPKLFLCINRLSLSAVLSDRCNSYTVNVEYSDVYPAFVRLVDSEYLVNETLLKSAQVHRKQDYLVCKASELERVLFVIKQIVSEPEYLNCYISGVCPKVLRRDGTSYVGVVVRLFYSCDYKTSKDRQKLCADKISTIANIARSSGCEDWRKAYAVINYCVDHWRYYLGTENGLEFTAYGALVQQKAVCMGFSLAVCAIFKELGIPCKYICGQKNGEDHAWNMVYINGGWFYIDVTDAVGMKDPLYRWGITELDDGRTIATKHGENLMCRCDRNFMLHRLHQERG